ncbi:FapA family protein [bacterium]|nr:FapA family protein [bacterium]
MYIANVNHYLIAKAHPHIQGKNAQLEYLFKTAKDIVLSENADGKVDHRELGLINNVLEHDLLALKTPLTEGEPGTNIYGDTVQPNPIKDVLLVQGNNTVLSESGFELSSKINGQVFLKGNKIHVTPIFMVAHDVDLNVGNINFNGNIVVNGNVLSGFTLRAKQDITVLGVVEGATLIAGGNIFIKSGYRGGGKGILQCHGNFTCKFVDSGNIEANGDVLIESSVIDSNIVCYSKLSVANKGSIVGGDIKAVKGIECKELGSKLGIPTIVTVGDRFVIQKRMEEAKKILEESKVSLGPIEESIKQMAPLFKNFANLDQAIQKKIQGITKQRTDLISLIEVQVSKIAKLEKLFMTLCHATISVHGMTYNDSTIIIGSSRFRVNDSCRMVRFSEDHVERRVKQSIITAKAK